MDGIWPTTGHIPTGLQLLFKEILEDIKIVSERAVNDRGIDCSLCISCDRPENMQATSIGDAKSASYDVHLTTKSQASREPASKPWYPT